MLRLLPLILKNARRNLRRTLFTVGGLGVSLFLFTALLTVVSSLDGMLERSASNPILLVTPKAGWAHVMPESHGSKLAHVPGVRRIAPYLFYGGSYGDVRGPQDSFTSMGTEGDVREIWGHQLVIPEADFACYLKERTGAVVGQQLLARFGWTRGQKVKLRGTAWPVDLEFVICGQADFETDKSSFVMHRSYLEAALGNPGYVTMFAVQVATAGDVAEVSRRITETFATTGDPVRAQSQRQFMEGFLSVMGDVRGLVRGIAVLVLLAVMLLVANSIAMSTRERTVELAVLKALGFRGAHIVTLVVGEALVLGLFAGGIGCGAAYALFGGRGFAIGVGPLSGFSVTPEVLGWGVVAALVVAVLASALPALRALRAGVVEGLRHVA